MSGQALCSCTCIHAYWDTRPPPPNQGATPKKTSPALGCNQQGNAQQIRRLLLRNWISLDSIAGGVCFEEPLFFSQQRPSPPSCSHLDVNNPQAMYAVPIIKPAHKDLDVAAAKLQLAELQGEVTRDARFALQLYLEDLGQSEGVDGSLEALEVQLLQAQVNNLLAAITEAEDEQAAVRLLDTEEAMQAASLQLADALQAQEQWDANVLRPHDGALARRIAGCDEWEWQEWGDHIEQPLDTSSRPVEPVIVTSEYVYTTNWHYVA